MPKAARRASAPKENAGIDPRFAPVDEAFRKDGDVTAGKLFSAIGLKVHGKIFAMFPKGEFVAKLPKARVDELIAQKLGKHFDPGHGRLMKEWIALRGHDDTWVALAREARRYVGGLSAIVAAFIVR
jgi:hypothetical protein